MVAAESRTPVVRYGSLCSGVGGLDLAVEAVFDAEPAWFCEADVHAASVLAAHWPGVPIYPDLKTQDWTTVEPVELVCAGYPCQPFSYAGRRRGEADPRHLWPDVITAVRVLRPRFVVLENVAGHLRLGFDRVLGDLAEAGFDAEWTVVRAADAGACHRRERLFVVAYTDQRRATADPAESERRGPERPAVGAPVERTAEPRERVSATPTDWGDYGPAIERWERILGRPAPAPAEEGRLAVPFVEWMMGFPEGWVDGLSRTAALRCLGNAVVPQQGALALAGLT